MRRHSTSSHLLEFFAGVGLVRVALEAEGVSCVFANDLDAVKAQTYNANFSGDHLLVENVQALSSDQLPSAELATASFPCVNLSQAGTRDGLDGSGSGLVWAFLRLIEGLNADGRAPRALLLENVPGMLTQQAGRRFGELLETIASLGYSFDVVQVDARHFLPQSRNRVFVIAFKSSARAEDQDIEEALSHPIRRHNIAKVVRAFPHLPWHFFPFPALPKRRVALSEIIADPADDDRSWWTPKRMESFWAQLERLRVNHEEVLRSLQAQPGTHYLTAVRRGRRRHHREQVINLRTDGLASCLRTPKGGSSIQLVVRVRNGEVRVRRMNGVEYARLQGVALPDSYPDFVLPTKEQDRLFAFGDAVCVPAVQWVFQNSLREILESRGGKVSRVRSVTSRQLALPV